jgi:hypothetical protein
LRGVAYSDTLTTNRYHGVQHRSTFSVFPHGTFTTFPRTAQFRSDDVLEPDDEPEASTLQALGRIALLPHLHHRPSDDSTMDSVVSVRSGSPGQSQLPTPTPPLYTATMAGPNSAASSERMRQLRPPRGCRRHHSSKSTSESKERTASATVLSGYSTHLTPPGPLFQHPATGASQVGQMIHPPMLAPLPLGDPILPQVLQAVPYSTVQDLRPPLSRVLQYQAVAQTLPSISQLIEASLEIDTTRAARTNATSHEDHDMISEPFGEASIGSCDHEDDYSTHPTHNVQLQTAFDRDQHFTTQHDPFEMGDDGLRLGLMRFYRNDPVPEPAYICSWQGLKSKTSLSTKTTI